YWAGHPDESAGWVAKMMGDVRWQPLANGKPYPEPELTFDPADCPIPPSYPNEPSLRKPLSHYYGSVNRMDQVVGSVLDALAKSGLAENTIVIFLSDHGLAWELSKWSLYPAGTKTPFIIKWPAKIKAGQVDKTSIVSVVDIPPTLAELCGIGEMPVTDGYSFEPLLSGNKENWKRSEAFSCFNYMNNDNSIETYSRDLYLKQKDYRPARALSSSNYTYVWNGWSDGETQLPPSMGTEVSNLLKKSSSDYSERIRFMGKRAAEEFYDIQSDPGCLNNLVGDEESRGLLNQFRGKMEAKLSVSRDHELDNYRALLESL
ncbi:MAG: sulfatase-like hydrolase/transferase, partial [Verrucomicrobiota bacterium]